MSEQKRLVVMISGSGTNLQALIDACAEGRLPAQIVFVFSNRKAAFGLERAAAAGIPTGYAALKAYRDNGRSRLDYDRDVAATIAGYRPDLVVLAGWMHILSATFLNEFPGRVINLHPALPGQFAGTQAIERAYAAFQAGEISGSGCMVHYTVPEVDAGPVIAQAEVPIQADDTLTDFAARMHAAEHELIVRAAGLALRHQA